MTRVKIEPLSTEAKRALWRKRFEADKTTGDQIHQGTDPVSTSVEEGGRPPVPHPVRPGSTVGARPRAKRATRKPKEPVEPPAFRCSDGGATKHFRRRPNGRFVERKVCEGDVAHVGTVEINGKPFIHSAPLTRAQLRGERPMDGYLVYSVEASGDGRRGESW